VVALVVAPALVHLVDPLDPLEVDPPLHPVETPVSAAGLQAVVAGLHGAGLGAGAGAGAGLQAGAGALHGAGLGAGAGAFLHPAVVAVVPLLQPVDVGFLGAVVPVHPPLPFGTAPPGHLMVMVVTVSCATIGEVFWIILC